MTLQEVKWAQQHDWFKCAIKYGPNETYSVEVNDPQYSFAIYFDNFNDLKAWAGV